MEEWKEYKLGDFMEFNPKISLKKNTVARKITMDQLVPHSRDIYSWTYEPYSGGAKFQNGDTIMARITPCLENGKHAFISLLEENEIAYGSTEYIVIRGRCGISDNRFVYYLTHYPSFKEAAVKSMVGSSGRQRAQVDVLENLTMKLPAIPEQRRIAEALSILDDKIKVNKRINDNFVIEPFFEILLIWAITTLINDNLEQQGQALFEEYVMNPNMPRTQLLSDYALINPTRTIAKGRAARCIDMSSLPTKGTFPSDWTFKEYNGGMKFQNGDTIMARITPCLENGKTAYINFLDENEVAFGSTEYIVLSAHEGFCSELLYFLARYDDFVSYAVSHMNGSSGRQRVSGNDIANYVMPEITNETMDVISEKLHGIMEVIKNNSLESRRLAEIRDTLLPRLMSGELKLEGINM